MSKNNQLPTTLSEIGFKATWTAKVQTLITTRNGGISAPPFNSLNLGTHVGDNLEHVLKNRSIVQEIIPGSPYWLQQTHSNYVINLDDIGDVSWNEYKNHNFDASFTRVKNKVCVVMTADCLPILLTDQQSSFVASIHAGWKGVENGVIKNTISALKHKSHQDIIAYIGPSICQTHFEVGYEVKEQFIKLDLQNEKYFRQRIGEINKFDCDVVGIAVLQLLNLGLLTKNIYLSDICTYCQDKEFFSYRRDGKTGRIASFIWLP